MFLKLAAFLLLCGAAGACELQVMHGVPIYGSQVECFAKTSFYMAGPTDTVVVPEGQEVTLTGDAHVLDVLVRGKLNIDPGVLLKCRTFTVIGMEAVVRVRDANIIETRDGTFDPTLDPEEWGHGILALDGGQIVCETDDWRQGYAQVSREIKAGDQVIQLASRPHGWRAGDTLVVPDTRQHADGSTLSQWTETAVIDSVTEDGIVYLAAPVQFDHLGWHESDGDVGLLPDVANLTQPITFRSENPNGTRGHVAAIGSGAMYLKGVQAIGMGRTTTAPLSTTNRVGRYALWHFHHNYGRPNETREWQGEAIHCSVWDSPKWPGSIHNAYFINVEDCVAYNCAGGGLITEQVLSYGFRIKNCMVVAKQPGSGKRITERSGRNDSSPTADHWHDRVGLGLGSAMGEITGNRLYCCKESIGMAGFGTTTLCKPTARGVNAASSPANRITLSDQMGYTGQPKRYPFVFDTSGNIAWGGWRGIETWSAHSYVGYEKCFPGLTLIHCRMPTDLEDHQETVLHGWRSLGDFLQAKRPAEHWDDETFALDFKPGYRFGITCIDCEFAGHDAAFHSINDKDYLRFQGCTFECPTILYQSRGSARSLSGCDYEFTGCTFKPVNGAVRFSDGWYPKYGLELLQPTDISKRSDNLTNVPVKYRIRPWHDGRDIDVYHYEQHPSWSHKTIDSTKCYADWPAGVYSQQKLIELGIPIFGAAVPSTAFQSDGFGPFWADDATPCERKVELLKQRIKELESR